MIKFRNEGKEVGQRKDRKEVRKKEEKGRGNTERM